MKMTKNTIVTEKTNIKTKKIVYIEQINEKEIPDRRCYHIFKRVVEFFLCFIALLILAVPMLIVSILIKIDSQGPVLYKQERLGLNGKPFNLIKFRSMSTDAELNGAQWAVTNDARVTKVGKILRAYRIDEWPQFFQVLTGELSLIGPRPERKVFYEMFECYIPGFRQRLMVKPGITGLAQVNGGYDLLPEEKIIYDIQYIKNESLRLDIDIIFKTIGIIFSNSGAR